MSATNDLAGEFGEYLTNEYEILRRVFSSLSATDLRTCADVCMAWKEAAFVTIKQRSGIQCLTITDKNSKPLLSEAALTLSFNTLPRQPEEEDIGNACSKEVVTIVARYGIIGVTDVSKPLARRQRAELPLTPIAFLQAVARFSSHEDVIYRVVSIGHETLSLSRLQEIINLPEEVPIRAVLVFVYDDDADDNLMTLMKCLRFRKKDFALGGCRLEADESVKDIAIKCVFFAGSNLETGSCVLESSCRTSTDINSKVQCFSESVMQSKSSVLLAFRCCDRLKVRRHYNYTPQKNVVTWETDAMKTYFPKVPAIGCYGIGEFGLDYYPSTKSAKKPRLASKDPLSIEYGFSTILVYIGFKN